MLLSWNPFCTIAFFNFIFIRFCQPSIMLFCFVFFFLFPASSFVPLLGYPVSFMCHSFTSCLLWKLSRAAFISSEVVLNTLFSSLSKLSLLLKTQSSQLIRNKIIPFLHFLKQNMTGYVWGFLSSQAGNLLEECNVSGYNYPSIVLSLTFTSQPCPCDCSAIQLYLYSSFV